MRSYSARRRQGQTTTETILLLPLFLLLVFGVLQLGQLGVALLVSQYAAYSISRQMVQDNSTSAGGYRTRFEKVMAGGMRFNALYSDSPTPGLLSNVTVHACAEVNAFPFVGEFLKPLLNRYSGGCGSRGPFSFNGTPPYKFILHGQATSRMNYRP